MILRILEAEVCGDSCLRVAFNDGTNKVVNLRGILEGPVFEPLHERDFFARMELDPICGTVVWPNGADLAPEALYDLDPVQDPVDRSRS
jgi:uncharacterized protein DUF2442